MPLNSCRVPFRQAGLFNKLNIQLAKAVNKLAKPPSQEKTVPKNLKEAKNKLFYSENTTQFAEILCSCKTFKEHWYESNRNEDSATDWMLSQQKQLSIWLDKTYNVLEKQHKTEVI